MTQEVMKQALETLELVRSSHNVMLLSDPPQDAWKTRGVDFKILRAITSLRTALKQPEEKPVADVWTGCGECDSIFGCHDGKARCIRLPVEQQAEPVAWGMPDALGNIVETISPDEKITDMKAWADQYSVPLYATPPQRQWLGLIEQDMPSGEDPMFDHQYFIAGLVYADKVLKEKNSG